MRMVEFVFPIIGKKKLERPLQKHLILRIPQRPPHQHRRPISDIRGNHISRQLRPSAMPKHGINRMNQVQPRIDEGSVQIKNQEPNRAGIKVPVGADHGSSSRINDGTSAFSDSHLAFSQRWFFAGIADTRTWPNAKCQMPRAKSQEPRTRAQSPQPKAEGHQPQATRNQPPTSRLPATLNPVFPISPSAFTMHQANPPAQ